MTKTTVEYVVEITDSFSGEVHSDTTYHFDNIEDAMATAKHWKEYKFKVAVYETTYTKLRLRVR